MNRFIFDLQRFDTVAINASESQTIDGVTYTATTTTEKFLELQAAPFKRS